MAILQCRIKNLTLIIGVTSIVVFQVILTTKETANLWSGLSLELSKDELLLPSSTQKIVILPGPHKTGTSSVQLHLLNNFRRHHPSFSNWSWPIPSQDIVAKYSSKTLSPEVIKKYVPYSNEPKTIWEIVKAHAILATRLLGTWYYIQEIPHTSSEVLSIYKETLQKEWEAGKNLLIASEEFCTIVLEEPEGEEQKLWWQQGAIHSQNLTLQQVLWRKIYDILPSHPGIHREIIGAIFFREPRSDHLVSVWHEAGKGYDLSEFLYTKLAHEYRSVNPLKMVQIMEASGQVDSIYILNTAGLERANNRTPTSSLDMVVACEIMEVPCKQTQLGRWYLEGDSPPPPNKPLAPKMNVKSDAKPKDLNSSTLALINEVLQAYDCQFQSYFLEKENIHYLYFDQPILGECSSLADGHFKNQKARQERKGLAPEFLPVVYQIQKIACMASLKCSEWKEG
jgi:hypothetical protein